MHALDPFARPPEAGHGAASRRVPLLRADASRARAVAAVALAATAVACSSRPEELPLGPPLQVMTFNIRYGTADDGPNRWQRRRALVIEVIRSEAPDLVGVQEALRFQLDEISRALPEYSVLGVGRDDGVARGEFAAILYRSDRFDAPESGTFWFSEAPDEPGSVAWGARIPRIATWARFSDRQMGRTFDVYNMHWDHESQLSRERSAALLRERLRTRMPSNPLIVMGDFNAGEENAAFQTLVDPAADPLLVDTYRAHHPEAAGVIGTFHGFRGSVTGDKIDAVLVSADWEILDAAIVHTSRDGRYPSDHYPVTARLALRTASETTS